MNAASNLLLSTVDSDIAKMSTNEFKPIFLGGLTIAFGSALSTVAVGMMIDSKTDGYQEILTEAYLEAIENSDEFWDRLDDTEKEKAREAIDQLKDKRGWGMTGGAAELEVAKDAVAKSGKERTEKAEEAEKAVKDIFSDY